MSLLPILIINLLLLVITISLAVADHFLVTYGDCKITITQEGQKKEFTVQGGDSLLPALIDNKINISSSCAGKATCGYCKVRVVSGGGEILPTEEIFMSRREKLENMRLACQVKVKNDIEIYIPDFLTTVANIVKDRLYDPKLRWSFRIAEQEYSIPEEKKIKKKVQARNKTIADAIIEEYTGREGALVPVLQHVNRAFTYLSEAAMKEIAEKMNLPLGLVYGVVTFYHAFGLKPKGKNIIRVCLGTACYVKGGQKILQTMERKLGIKVGETTEDRQFSLETVNCIGCCGQSPVISVNKEIYGYLKPGMIDDILHAFSNRENSA